MFALGINVPRAYEMINEDGRNGIIYERVNGKTLLQAISGEQINPLEAIDILAKEHQKLLERQSKDLVSYKNFLITTVKNKSGQTQGLQKRIRELPDGMNVLHGDFHPDNLMIKPDGKIIIIDCMNTCCGPALYDIARTYYLLREVNEIAADRYLSNMNVTKKDIEIYLKIIEEIRKYEG